jgi:chromosome segregation ATPase
MGLFNRKEKTVDLTERYLRQKDRMENLKEGVKQANAQQNPTQNSFGFLRDMASSSAPSESDDNTDERKRRLVKRLADITEKLEDLSTQIYHLQQRVELLERKNKLNFE